ncbi:ABC-F family ATP-binding cassette domain-containing protein [Chondrinema litorale]|uniref:ABC-F family ATP-binding cassette domain-containing protein n=1 Tax=Chondrinema litorale TaxID=2994555 RepID=UPI0025435B73|nr:ABC-F family ATP-binding cassette domain-containing protein [Chondrinema litorale]UZR94915.1 ABC-F family ATP-binding cassette domain-containing protein [Chondrinema litorale]
MLDIQNLSFHYGSRALYDEASLHIKPKNRIGLIGLNGTGKTTLLKLINGDLTPDGGSISKSNECTIGFLNQDQLSYQSDDSILNVALQGFEQQLAIQKQIDKVLHKMETAYEEKLVDKLAHLQERFAVLDGYSIHSKAEEILEGLGFKTEELNQPLRTFSGGWRMRVMLAKLLLQKPSVLMLDEPTNHLDLPSIQWLESYLFNYEGAVIIVSHDREFLDRAVNMIVEVSDANLNVYSGNYTFYLEEKELRNEIQRNAFKNQQQKIKQTERFIERFRSKATKARQVQSKVKMLDKIDKIGDVVDEKVDMNIRFTFSQQPGKFIISLKDVAKSYGDKEVIKDTHITLERGDKIGFVGANGKGKSTILRIIAGTEDHEGVREPGYNVIKSFYAQHQLESLNVENEILQELKEAGSEKTEMELRGILGCFLFTGDDVFKKIKVLSGGEKSRVALAKTLISQANFLLLDEPTNHLDILSVNILIQALQNYTGSYLIVSHDRHFIANTANKIWYIEDQVVKEYPGDFYEFNKWFEKRQLEKQPEKPKQVNTEKPKKKEVSTKILPHEELNAKKKELKSTQRQLSKAEEEIEKLEVEIKSAEDEMAKPSVYGDPFKLSEINAAYEKKKASLATKNTEWDELAEKIETLEEEIGDQ